MSPELYDFASIVIFLIVVFGIGGLLIYHQTKTINRFWEQKIQETREAIKARDKDRQA